ncbi:MAG TPA: glycosyltransferase [Pseudolabrys sp.]|jgi:glycosyltransferase involved in cell wall biosynthesis|nr:glycosyltransferase [Pseudolabrys sp.]
MLTVIIPTHESERSLVQTLAPLVSGATAGLIIEVIVADAGSHDATEEVADLAGCTYRVSDAPAGARLKSAAAIARRPWLLFLRPGTVPEPGWIEAIERFIGSEREAEQAAIFRRRRDEFAEPGIAAAIFALRAAWFSAKPTPGQGLLIARRLYDRVGGHPDSADGEAALLARLGRRRIALLGAAARLPRPHT